MAGTKQMASPRKLPVVSKRREKKEEKSFVRDAGHRKVIVLT